jgi:hypothetical protein
MKRMKHIRLFEEFMIEKVIDGVVTCDNCGWEWEISDGGNDPYVCHKCWNDNNPV